MWPTFTDTEDQDQDTVTASVALVVPASSGATAAFDVALNEVGFEWKTTIELQVDSDPAAKVAEPRTLTFTAGERRWEEVMPCPFDM